uniref:Reverse transcriptase domain-containing protein n=2 Tax=Tanacetum cinerariifolium TaxID=118510 RepID=A0A699HKU2_TANCI|nr:hypothetical protein [Tanacetum cinerariifolium]
MGKTSGANVMNKDTYLNEDSESDVKEGLRRTPKQSEVRQVVNENRLSIYAILESHVDFLIFPRLPYLGWNLDIVNVMVVSQTSQVMHVKIIHKFSGRELFCSFVYVNNLPVARRSLWADLELNKNVTRCKPWILMGDFNVVLNLEDYSSGSVKLNYAISDFKDCVYNIEVMDINSLGLHFTWNQKPKGGSVLLKKLDRIMGNTDFIGAFPGAYALFQPYTISDHSPTVLDLNPNDLSLREEEDVYVQAFSEAKLDEERFLKQKAKIEWLVYGTQTLHISTSQSKTKTIEAKISVDSFSNMVRPVTNEEIKAVMFSIGDERAPGLDGFSSAFFKKGRDIVGLDIFHAIRDFFINGRLLKDIDHTFIALIPKVSTPHKINDYRPISCCNVIYKCISKILTNRIIDGIKEVVSNNQSTFVLGRHISDNILITQELMHNYHCNRGPPRCAFKINIQKAYDTMDWWFLGCVLNHFGFHPLMIKWIMACVTSTSFSLNLNGDIHGFFKGKRGLRQGDPLSSYLFTLVMEMIFLLMESLDEFKTTSGLVPSIPKSTTFFCNVPNHVKISILNIMSFAEGNPPVKYLGVCLISSRLLNKDCKVLVEKAKNRIEDWKNKSFLLPIGCNFHQAWIAKAPILNIIPAPNLDENTMDCIRWRDLNGVFSEFSVTRVWEIFRPYGIEVNWFRIMWFPHSNPCHSFNLWLVMRNSLKTQDKLMQWDVGINTDLNLLQCSLCNTQSDSHAHLFFDYPYSAQVWKLVRHLADMEFVPSILHDIVDHL